MDGAPALDRHGLLGRFDASTEPEYEAWFLERFRPLAIAMGWASIVSWIVNPLIVVATLDLRHPVLVFVVCWAVNVPALLGGIVYLRWATGPRAVAVASALVVLTAVETTSVVLPQVSGLEPTAFALSATFYSFLAPLIQLPFRPTFLIGVVVTVTGELTLLLASDHPTQSVVLSLTFVPLSSLLVGPAMAFTNERDLRGRFAAERMIEHQRGLVRRYAPSSVVSRIELGDTTVDHPQRRKVTIFFSDVVGFTAMADRVDPESLAEIVNEYLGALSDLIERHGGTLNEFAGDGVMAIFGAPEDLDPADQVRAALTAAHELQASLPRWSRGWYQHGIVEDAKARVGINTGTVSVGTFGSTVRATYTGIGLQTNIAARVQAQAEPGGILLSNTSWHLVKDVVACEPRGEVMVKGVHFPIELYAPMPK